MSVYRSSVRNSEKKCLEMAPECLRRTQLSEVGWQSIPRSRSCDAECSVSELPIGPWHDEIARLAVRRAGRPDTSAADVSRSPVYAGE